MFTYKDALRLIKTSDKEELQDEISKLSEGDAKAALTLIVLAWKKNNEVYEYLLKNRSLEENSTSPHEEA